MASVITGLFSSPSEAACAIDALVAHGIPNSDISLVASDEVDRTAFGVDTHSKLPEGAAIGAGTGGAVGALVAGFTAVGTIASGGAGLLVAGPIVAALAGAGAGAAAGASVGALVGLAIPEHEVKYYENAIEEGSVLVGVQYDDRDRKQLVKDVFEEHDVEKVSHA